MNAVELFRSNYVQVRDLEQFRAWCESSDLTMIDDETPITMRRYGFVQNGEHGIIRTEARFTKGDSVLSPGEYDLISDEEAKGYEERDEEINIVREFATHMIADEIGVVMEIGYEGQRAYWGLAYAVNHAGTTVTLDLNDIYGMAYKQFGVTPRRAEDH